MNAKLIKFAMNDKVYFKNLSLCYTIAIMKEKEALLKKVEMSLDTMRSYLQKDGGDIEVIDLNEEYVLSLQFIGNCSSCSQTAMTSAGIEEAIKNYIPEIKEVVYLS